MRNKAESSMRLKASRGFTLIEMMIVVLVVSILAGLAYYNYGRYAMRARRADGKELLARVAAAQERYYTNFNQYATAITGAPPGLNFTSLLSEKGYYTISTANGPTGNTQPYTLTATPVPGKAQAKDVCGALTLNNQNTRTPLPGAMPQNSNGSCW